MKDKVFLDTNILIYAIDTSPIYRRKQEIARIQGRSLLSMSRRSIPQF